MTTLIHKWTSLAHEILLRRGAVSRLTENLVLSYRDPHIFLECDQATKRLWFSVLMEDRNWETIIDIADDGTLVTFAVYLEADEISWKDYLQKLLDEAEDWPHQAHDRPDPFERLGQIGQVDAADLRAAIAHLETLIGMGLGALTPIHTLIQTLMHQPHESS